MSALVNESPWSGSRALGETSQFQRLSLAFMQNFAFSDKLQGISNSAARRSVSEFAEISDFG
jgi:hypothetical protein